jgi:ABC-2 type transport system permease protein
VQGGNVPIAVVLPRGLGESIGSFGKQTSIQLLADPSDPIASQVAIGLIQKAVMTSLPDLVAERGIAMFDRYGGGLTPEQRKAVDGWLPELRKRASGAGQADAPAGAPAAGAPSAAPTPASSGISGLVPVEVVDVIRAENPKKGIVAFYAAGIGVMFLLFTASGAGGALIEEVESGTLERLLSTRLGMGRLLLGKWLYLTLLGSSQLVVMFVFGALVFGLELVPHLAGFAVMTAVTASASAGFGLLLAALCRTRAQLGGFSTVVILVMSALGGSMFPRFLMSPTMQKMGLFTFNGWALDGFVKVFWRDVPLLQLWPQVLVLACLAALFLGIARLAARRWETA